MPVSDVPGGFTLPPLGIVGVGHRCTLVASDSPPSPLITCGALTSASHDRGVGHPRAASVSVVPECRPLSVEYANAPEEAASFAVAVGQDEESLTLVRGSNVGRGEQTPLRIEPEFGKVGKHFGEPKRKVSSDVLEEREGGGDLFEDPPDLGPEVAFVVCASSLPRCAERLARVPAANEIHRSTPCAAIEGAEIVEDRSAIQARFFHPGHEDGRGERVPLDVAHGATPSGQAEIEPADPGAEREGT